ncbi:MAG TPA: alpha/beta hydrolase [Kofleriaceae bacterium]|nr:alpha/beta hydrolase [Kofleriaceae bacterium]
MTRGALAVLLVLGACASSHGYAQDDVVFTRYSALSRNAELARRTLPPRTYRALVHELAARHQQLAEQAIDLPKEKFDLYVPAGAPPPAGYGLLVFVSPGSGPTRPRTWRSPLDRHRLIFVSAQGSGNEQSVVDRRVPLALLAYENIRARFPVDPARVYIGGLSGGSRVAEMLALAYPDVFRGAMLNAGADPIDGRDGIYKPPAELFRAFQRSRLVYITGDQDHDTLLQDEVSRRSMRDACVLDVKTEIAFGLGHQALDARFLDQALDALEAPRAVDEGELARCNARVERAIAAGLDDIAAAIARGDRDAARGKLKAIEARFGGLTAPRILELEDRLGGSTAVPGGR